MILDEKLCRPFDAGRSSLNLGEGAGYLVLQREKMGYLCQLAGWANRIMHHQTTSSTDGDGAYLAMKEALNKAKLSPAQVNYISSRYGYGNNDAAESAAFIRLFGKTSSF